MNHPKNQSNKYQEMGAPKTAGKIFHEAKKVFWEDIWVAILSHSQSICILWSDLRVLWTSKHTIKSHDTPLGFCLQTDMN